MLDPKNAIRIEKQPRKCGGPRTVYVFVCNVLDCKREIKCRSGIDLLQHSEKCSTHSHIKRPFESIYNCLLRDHRKIKVELTYEEFLQFTNIGICHYCHSKIKRNEYATVAGKYISRAYFLDRKDNSGP